MRFFQTASRRLLSHGHLGVPLLAAGLYGTQRSTCNAPGASGEDLPELVQQAAEERKRKEELKCPGGFEKIIEEGKRIVTIDSFEGFRLEVQKMVTPQFCLAHSYMLGTNIPNLPANAIYDFSTHVMLPGNQLLVARLGHGGSIDGRYHVGVGENAVLKFVASLQPNAQKDSFQAEGEYNGPDYTLCFRAIKGPQVYASYMQSITPSFALGGDTTYDLSEGAGTWSLGGKWSGDGYAFNAMLAQFGQVCLVQYIRRVSPNRMTLVADLVFQPMTLDSQAVLGAEVNMKQSRFVTTIDSDFKIASFIEARVVPNALTLLLSAEVLQSKNHYKFGYGVQLNT